MNHLYGQNITAETMAPEHTVHKSPVMKHAPRRIFPNRILDAVQEQIGFWRRRCSPKLVEIAISFVKDKITSG